MKLLLNNKLIYPNVNCEELYDAFDGINERIYNIVILEDGDSDSYIQTVCNKFEGVLEARIYSGPAFRHYRCEISCGAAETDNRERRIPTALFTMTVRQKQVINVSTIKKIMLHSIENNTIDIDKGYSWVEMDF